jgi:hypothetical protein
MRERGNHVNKWCGKCLSVGERGVLLRADALQCSVYIISAPNYLAVLHLLKCTVLH